MTAATPWLTRDVLLICLSACFADLGYQAVLAIFPLFLVMNLHAAVWVFALATAISYGPGAIFGLIGGRLGDRYGHKKMAIGGNLLIPLLSLSGLATVPAAAVALFAGGWWARNFRSPPRRTLMTQMVTRDNRAKAFGFLHALDIGGGFLAATGAMILIWGGVALKEIFLITIIPLLCSSAVLAMVRSKKAVAPDASAGKSAVNPTATPADDAGHRSLYRRLLWATGLYGFSSFSFGFPILTVDQATGSRALAVLAYVVFFGVSALTGLVVGRFNKRNVKALALAGYLAGGIGAAGMAFVSTLHNAPELFYPVVALMGLALGVIETLEPTIISLIIPQRKTGSGMGALTATRSLGLFFANILMGLLYNFHASWVWSYGYAAILAMVAAGILLSAPAVDLDSAG
jgi:MFS family permease